MPQTVIVTAILKPIPEKRDELIALMSDFVAEVHILEEPEKYTINSELSGDRLVFIEKWIEEDGGPVHVEQPHVVRYLAQQAELLRQPMELIVSSPIPAGNPVKGTL